MKLKPTSLSKALIKFTRREERKYHLCELRLDGDGMDAFVVEKLFDADGDDYVVGRIATTDVSRSDDSRRRQLPYVQLVYVLNSFHLQRSQTD